MVGGVCITKNNQVLLLKEKSKKWSPPVGHNKSSETLTETAIRETKEECNLDVTLTGIVEIGLYKFSDGRIYLITFYGCEVKNLSKLKIDNKEIIDYRWANLNDLENDKINVRHAILKPILIRSFKGPLVPLDIFKEVEAQI